MTATTPADIVVVDDEPDLAHLFQAWLGEHWNARAVTDGRSALELVDDSTDLVVMDRRMPDIRGDEVLRILRERGFDCQVLFVSAAEPDADVVDLPFDEYLVKPVHRDELVDIVDTLLSLDHDEELRSLQRLATKKRILEGNRRRVRNNNRDALERITQRIDETRERLADQEQRDQLLAEPDGGHVPDISGS